MVWEVKIGLENMKVACKGCEKLVRCFGGCGKLVDGSGG